MGTHMRSTFVWILAACILFMIPATAQSPRDDPYPLLIHFLGKQQAFSATFVSAVQGEDGMLLEGTHSKVAYLNGMFRDEGSFSDQWNGLYAGLDRKRT